MDKTLSKLDFISPLSKCYVIEIDDIKPKIKRKKRKKQTTDNGEAYDVDAHPRKKRKIEDSDEGEENVDSDDTDEYETPEEPEPEENQGISINEGFIIWSTYLLAYNENIIETPK